jgi:hypothetical protein
MNLQSSTEEIAMQKPRSVDKDKAVKDSKATRSEVRQEVHRTQVPRQSQRPAERSNQHRGIKK